MSDDDILIAIAPSQGRRWLGVLCLGVLGILLIGLVLKGEASAPWQLGFLATACATFWAAKTLYDATADSIELTRNQLRTASGLVLAEVDNVKAVERGAFSFKPSNGFLVRLKEPLGRTWAPGLYWRRGRLLGIGGVISGGQSRAMAEMLAALAADLPELDELLNK